VPAGSAAAGERSGGIFWIHRAYLASVAALSCACGLTLTLADAALATSAAHKVTGTVRKIDDHTGRFVIDGQTFVRRRSGPLALEPQVGHKVTLFYEGRNGQKVVTRIGQAAEAGQLR
jgi:hypothetical protein